MRTHTTRPDCRAPRPQVVACLLRTDTPFLTFASDRPDSGPHNTRVRYGIIGLPYGWLYTTAGDIRFWASRSGAARHLARHILPFDYGARRDYRKIDLFDGRGRYLCSTTWARDCAEALDHCTSAYTARYAKA